MTEWMLAVLPLVGVILGATLQHRFARSSRRDQHLSELRAAAYADYLRAVAAAGHLRTDEELRDALRDAADAKARIAVYGSREVVEALARFEEHGAILAGPGIDALAAVVTAMRPATDHVARGHVRFLLAGTRDGQEEQG